MAQQPSDADGNGPDASSGMTLRLDARTAVWIVLGILGAFAWFAVARGAASTLTRVVMGIVLALALDPLVQRISHRWRVTRSVAVGLVGVGLLALALFVLLVLGPPAVKQARQFSTEIPQTVEQLYDLPLVGHQLQQADAATKVQDWIDQLPANISDEAIANTAERLVGGVLSTVIVLATTFALLLDGERIVNRVRRLLPAQVRDDADRIGRVLHHSIGRYFGGSLTVAALMGLYVLTIGLAFNVPLAPLAAIWAMFTDLIPQVGGFLGGAFLGILAVSQSVTTALVVVVLFVVYMNLENHVISPAIVGQAVNLSPPTTMLAAFIGGAVAGVPGALIGTPLVGAAKRLFLDIRAGGDGRPAPTGDSPGLFARVRRLVRRRSASAPATD